MKKKIAPISKIEREIARLELKKRRLQLMKDAYFCESCRKQYKRSACKEWAEFSGNGAFLEALPIRCPRGHEADTK